MDVLELEGRYELDIASVEQGDLEPDGFRPIEVVTTRGRIGFRYYHGDGARAGVVWMGGVGGGWDTPAKGLYPRLCHELQALGISSCRVRFRRPTSLPESVLDALVAVRFLNENGCVRVGVVGHSAGGSVAIHAASHAPVVKTVVTLATQSYGVTQVTELAASQSILLIHGANDDVLPPSCSQTIHAFVPGHKRLIIHSGAGHMLDEVADEVAASVRNWVVAQLSGNGHAVD